MSSGEETPNTGPIQDPIQSTSEAVTEQTNEPNTADGEASASALEVADEKAVASVSSSSSSDEYIRLHVINSDMRDEVHFRVKSVTALGRLKRSYCSKLGFQVEHLRFFFDGHRITDDDTPFSLGMINDNVIEIYQERTGGM